MVNENLPELKQNQFQFSAQKEAKRLLKPKWYKDVESDAETAKNLLKDNLENKLAPLSHITKMIP